MTDGLKVERSPRVSLARHAACIWTERSGRADPLLPDAAVELVWSGRGLFVRGADTRAHPVDPFPERTFVVLRFLPGAAPGIIGLAGSELADARVGVSELWGRAEMERIESLLRRATPVEAGALLEDVVEAQVREAPDLAVQTVVTTLRSRDVPVAALAARLGLSERQLLRRCTAALGYGPKVLSRIFRFQRFRSLAGSRAGFDLAELAAEAGYADQPHLTRECVRMAGETPARLLARI